MPRRRSRKRSRRRSRRRSRSRSRRRSRSRCRRRSRRRTNRKKSGSSRSLYSLFPPISESDRKLIDDLYFQATKINNLRESTENTDEFLMSEMRKIFNRFKRRNPNTRLVFPPKHIVRQRMSELRVQATREAFPRGISLYTPYPDLPLVQAILQDPMGGTAPIPIELQLSAPTLDGIYTPPRGNSLSSNESPPPRTTQSRRMPPRRRNDRRTKRSKQRR